MKRTLIVFAKEPLLGTVKTRLKDHFSDKELLRLYAAFAKDTLAVAKKVRCGNRIIAFSSPGYPSFLKRAGRDFKLIEQEGRNLGERMHNGFVCAKKCGSKKTVIIGTDAPTLPAQAMKKAFRELDKKELVLGPSIDGGYYLIGMKEPCFDLFKGVQWSTSGVLDKTLKNARSLGKTVALLDEWYDVDDCQGLSRLINELKTDRNQGVAFNTRRVLKAIT